MGKFLNNLKSNDVVVGSRRVKGSKLLVRQNPMREFLGKCFTFLVRVTIDPRIRDATCGFKAFTKEAADKIFSNLTVYNWAFDAEVLFLCRKYRLQMAQVPVDWSDKKGSKVPLIRGVFTSLLGLFQIRFNDFLGKYG
jgi:hypothetical protein